MELSGPYSECGQNRAATNQFRRRHIMKKRILALGTAAVLALSLTACGSSQKAETTAAAADKTYNGASQTGVTGSYVSWANSTTGIDAGSYTATATPDENHAWSDGTTAIKSITWTMSAKEVAVTWGTTTTFIYNGVAQGPTASAESGVTGETINITMAKGGGWAAILTPIE